MGQALLLTALLFCLVPVHSTRNKHFLRRQDDNADDDNKPWSSTSTLYTTSGSELSADEPELDNSDQECPYIVHTEEEAFDIARNEAIPGNVVKVEHLTFCRTGNHFMSMYKNLAVGYCCKSKLVILPPKDDVLAPGIFNEGIPGPRWFDFSNAPDVKGFDARHCKADITWAGQRAFRMDQIEDPQHEHYTPGLRECVLRAPRLVGCEAAYFFPSDIDVCTVDLGTAGDIQADTAQNAPKQSHKTLGAVSVRKLRGQEEQLGQVREHSRSLGSDGKGGWNKNVLAKDDVGTTSEEREAETTVDKSRETPPGGNLVLHVRSGDIFDDDVLSNYGQPPLQWYMKVIADRKWERIEIITNSHNEQSLNPVFTALQAKVAAGVLPENTRFYADRTMAQDMQSIMCADALGGARSTLISLTAYHTNAKRIYSPVECNSELARLASARPDVKILGLDWPRKYTVYQKWQNTMAQRQEMLSYDRIKGFVHCPKHRLYKNETSAIP